MFKENERTFQVKPLQKMSSEKNCPVGHAGQLFSLPELPELPDCPTKH